MNKSFLKVENMSVNFSDTKAQTQRTVIDNLDLEINEGEFVCVVGPSGCGKTTLLNSIAGFQQYTGSIKLDDKEIEGPGADRGVMFQEYGLYPWFTVQDNVEFGPKMAGKKTKECHEISKRYLEMVGLYDFRKQYPNRLSGGMKQRVSLARVLANQPKFLLMDEPFAALDEQTRNILQQELLQIWEKNKITCMFITHSLQEAVYLADRVIVMMPNPGRVALDLHIDIDRIRSRNDSRMIEYQEQISGILKGE